MTVTSKVNVSKVRRFVILLKLLALARSRLHFISKRILQNQILVHKNTERPISNTNDSLMIKGCHIRGCRNWKKQSMTQNFQCLSTVFTRTLFYCYQTNANARLWNVGLWCRFTKMVISASFKNLPPSFEEDIFVFHQFEIDKFMSIF